MPKFDQEDEDQVVAQADDFDDEDTDDEEDFDDEDEDTDDEDDAAYDEVAVLAEIDAAEQAHKDAIADYTEVVTQIRQRQVAEIQKMAAAGAKVANIKKIFPAKLVTESVPKATPVVATTSTQP